MSSYSHPGTLSVLCGHVWRRRMQSCKKRSCSGIFKPGCEGPWMQIQECVLLGLVLSYNYGVENKYQAHLVPWDVKNIRSNLPSKSLEAQIPQVLCQITTCCWCTCDFCFTLHHQRWNWDASQVFTASTTTNNPFQKAVITSILLSKEWEYHEEIALHKCIKLQV